MAGALPATETIRLERAGSRLYVTLDSPQTRNALSEEMVGELLALVAAIKEDRGIRALVLRGAGGNFCAGGDVKGFRRMCETPPPAPGQPDPIAERNRRFGMFLAAFDALPQTVIAVIEGSAYGGGLGLACVADVAIAARDARFALSETGLGVAPTQIAPFVLRRVGLSEARRLALTGARFDGSEALRLGLVHFAANTGAELETTLAAVLDDVGRCAPGANAATKEILRMSVERPLEEVLDFGAAAFAQCLRGPEGREGVAAFIEKRRPRWVEGRD